MSKAAIIVLAGTESHADLGRVVNGMQAAKEFADAGDEVELIFDGAGTQWIAELSDEDHDAHALYNSLEEHVQVCDYCAGAFEQDDAVEDAAVERVDEFDGHPSVKELVDDGYEVITY
ncbi:DsrE family protein [Haloarchaeobius sp. HME9146]|uniref:DsrE family protein n=1 Tax=unclassified Haloarchaeobius TaxID=2614452 RepID=UPI0021BF1DA4|nr:DsrE family protein [Haloarchaeobius sp. HME9146]MCT9097925.1 DsrE family protein [Haloarchaeobius sp. HME9146]